MEISQNLQNNSINTKIEELCNIVHTLRSPEGCSWDAKQTHESIRKHLIEESYEVIDAIDLKDKESLKEELGDLLLQVILHSEIASENSDFTINEVIDCIKNKLIRRHPHVFKEKKKLSTDEVIKQWEDIKSSENNNYNKDYYLKTPKKHLPSLMESQKIQKKLSKIDFDWESIYPVIDKVQEELSEVKEAILENNPQNISEEIGDLLFSVSNLSRKFGYESELLLHQANLKFVKRIQKIEDLLSENNNDLLNCSKEKFNLLWDKVKSIK